MGQLNFIASRDDDIDVLFFFSSAQQTAKIDNHECSNIN